MKISKADFHNVSTDVFFFNTTDGREFMLVVDDIFMDITYKLMYTLTEIEDGVLAEDYELSDPLDNFSDIYDDLLAHGIEPLNFIPEYEMLDLIEARNEVRNNGNV